MAGAFHVIRWYGNKEKLRQAGVKFSEYDERNADILKNPENYTKEERDAAMHTFNAYAAREFGVKNAAGVNSYRGEEIAGTEGDYAMTEEGVQTDKASLQGFRDIDTGTIHINDGYQDGSTEDYVKVDGHEMGHHIAGQQGTGYSEAGADRFSDQTWGAFEDEVGAGSLVNQDGHDMWMNNQDYRAGNVTAGLARNIEGLPANELLWDSKFTSGYTGDKNRKLNTSKVKQNRPHIGVDMNTSNKDKSVVSAADGVVNRVKTQVDKNGKETGFGNYVVIKHSDKNGNPEYRTIYGHLESKPNLEVGSSVKEGQTIGRMGNTGTSDGEHLHFQIEKYDPKAGFTNSKGQWQAWVPINPKASDGSYINIGQYDTREAASSAIKK